MNGNGDLPTQYLGDGSVSSPSQGFFYEPNTGIYHDLDTYPNTAWTMVKKGNKRIRVDDNLTTISGPVSIPGLAPSTTGSTVTLAIGSASAPSLNFTGDTTTGLFWDSKGTIGIASGGTESAFLEGTLAVFTNLSCNSLLSAGTINCGTNSMTCGALHSASITSGSITAGTNSIQAGSFISSAAIPTIISGSTTQTSTLFADVIDSNTATEITSSAAILFPPGSVTNPSISFSTATSSGLYSSVVGDLDYSSLGSQVLHVQSNSFQSFVPITCGTNVLTCGPLSSSGNWNNGTNSIFTGSITPSLGITNQGQILSSFDTKSAPSYSWTGDSKTGIYRSSANTVGITCGGTTAALFTATTAVLPTLQSNDITANGTIGCTGLSSSGTISCGTNSLTSGAITSSGSFSNGTNSLTCGAITSSGSFSNGTNSSTTGSLTCASLKCGVGTTIHSFDCGITTLTAPNVAGLFGNYTSPTISFNGTFTSTPTVLTNLNYIGGGANWGNVTCIVNTRALLGFTVILTNVGAVTTVGNINIAWIAFN